MSVALCLYVRMDQAWSMEYTSRKPLEGGRSHLGRSPHFLAHSFCNTLKYSDDLRLSIYNFPSPPPLSALSGRGGERGERVEWTEFQRRTHLFAQQVACALGHVCKEDSRRIRARAFQGHNEYRTIGRRQQGLQPRRIETRQIVESEHQRAHLLASPRFGMVERGKESLFGPAVETVEDTGNTFMPVCLPPTRMRAKILCICSFITLIIRC